jgi:hypothetical protein
MNPLLEYAIRTNIFKDSIYFPFSLLLQKYGSEFERVILTFHRVFGDKKNEKLTVKHWHLTKCQKSEILPPFDENTIDVQELFVSPHTILPGYYPLEYLAEFYPCGQRQVSDPPYGVTQERLYRESVTGFFYSKNHKLGRKNWLWTSFMAAFLPQSFSSVFANHTPNNQQSVIADNFPVIWKGWQMWTKYLMINEGLIAPELLFSKIYEDKLKELNLWKKKPTSWISTNMLDEFN